MMTMMREIGATDHQHRFFRCAAKRAQKTKAESSHCASSQTHKHKQKIVFSAFVVYEMNIEYHNKNEATLSHCECVCMLHVAGVAV